MTLPRTLRDLLTAGLWAAFVLAVVVAGLIVSSMARAQGQVQFRCTDDLCLIARSDLANLAAKAASAERWAAMCGWSGFRR